MAWTCLLLGWFALLFSNEAAGQNLPFRKVGPGKGLPGSFVYGSRQDLEGQIWFATPKGAIRFDGRHGRRFTLSDGLPAQDILACISDGAGRTWLLGHKVTPMYHADGKLHRLADWDLREGEILLRMMPGRGGRIWIFTTLSVYEVDEEGRVKDCSDFADREQPRGALTDGEGREWFLCKRALVGVKNGDTLRLAYPNEVADADRLRGAVGRDGRLLIWGKEMELAVLDPRQGKWADLPDVGGEWEEGEAKWACDAQGNLWGTAGVGLWMFSKASDYASKQLFFPDLRIMGIDFDREGNLWVSTASQGAYMIAGPVLGTQLWSREEGLPGTRVTALEADNEGRIWMGFENGNVAVLGAEGIQSIQFEAFRPYSRVVRSIKSGPDGRIWVGGANGLHGFSSPEEMVSIQLPEVKALVLDGEGGMWVGGPLDVLRITASDIEKLQPHRHHGRVPKMANSTQAYFEFAHTTMPKGAYAIGLGEKGRVRVGNAWGMWSWEGNERPEREASYANTGVSKMVRDSNGGTWVGTEGKGLFYERGGDTLRFHTGTGLSGDFIQDIDLGDEGRIWVSTLHGVDLIRTADRPMHRWRPESPAFLRPLLGLETLCLLEHGGKLHAGTNEGLIRMSLSEVNWIGRPPRSEIVRLEVMGRDRPMDKPLSLAAHENELAFQLRSVLLTAQESLRYRYRLLGAFSEYRETPLQTIRFYQLPPGSYVFECYAVHPGAPDEAKPLRFSFTIDPRWYQRTWVQILAVALLLAIGLGVWRWRWRQLRRTWELRQRVIEARHQALLAQMDPHFVFNTMNLVQGYISEGDRFKANQALARIARLIRQVMGFADASSVRLEEEMGFLELYFGLEAERFQEELSLEWALEPEIDPATARIPAMVLQPLLENALRHGFPRPGRPGKVKIGFERRGETLVCSVEDNGVGRAAAAGRNRPKVQEHVSRGLALTEERLAVLGERMGMHFTLEIEDLVNEIGTAEGTRVLLILPLL